MDWEGTSGGIRIYNWLKWESKESRGRTREFKIKEPKQKRLVNSTK